MSSDFDILLKIIASNISNNISFIARIVDDKYKYTNKNVYLIGHYKLFNLKMSKFVILVLNINRLL